MTFRSTPWNIANITDTTAKIIRATTTTEVVTATAMGTVMEMKTPYIDSNEQRTLRPARLSKIYMKRLNVCSKYLVVPFFLLALLATTSTAQDRAAAGGNIGGGGVFGSGAAGPIGAGDLVEMSVFDTPELSGKLRVNNTGDIILPLVGAIHVEGLTTLEAQTLIRQKFIDGGFLKDPQVTVFVSEYATQGVSVVGEVRKPGIYPAFGSHRLLDYISLAEGLTPMAGTTITITHLGHPDQPEHFKITSGSAPSPENNPEIVPGDTIFVEKTGLVYIVGDVVRPGGFPMDHDDHLSILQLVALAQGVNYTAAKGSV